MFLLTIAISLWSLLGVTEQKGRPDSLQTLLINAGRALNLREYARARDCYDAAYNLDSNNIEVLRNLAILHSTVGDHKNALKLLLRAEKLAPEDPSVCNNLATTYSVMGESAKAISYFEKAVKLKPENSTYLANLGMEYARAGRGADGLEVTRKAAQLDTLTIDIPIILGDCFSTMKKFDSSDFYYSRAIAMGGGSTELFYQRGFARQNLKRMDDAESDYRAALTHDSTCRDCRQGLGIIMVTKGNYADALDQFRQVVIIDSTFAPGWVSLGVMLAVTGETDRADAILYRLFQADSALGFRMLDLINLENAKIKAKKP